MTDSGILFCFSLFCNLLSCSPPFPTLPLELEVELHLPSPSDPQTNRVAPVRSASNSCSEALLPPGVRLHYKIYKSLHYWCCFQDVHVKALPHFMTHSRNGMGRLGCQEGSPLELEISWPRHSRSYCSETGPNGKGPADWPQHDLRIS